MKFIVAIAMIVFGYTCLYYAIDQIKFQGQGISFGTLLGLSSTTPSLGGIIKFSASDLGTGTTTAPNNTITPTGPSGSVNA